MFDHFCMDSQECFSENYETCTKTPRHSLEIYVFVHRNSNPSSCVSNNSHEKDYENRQKNLPSPQRYLTIHVKIQSQEDRISYTVCAARLRGITVC